MSLLPKLPMAFPCSHYRYEGTRYGCAVLGECKPIKRGPDVSGCPSFHSQRLALVAKPRMSISEVAAANKRCREAKAAGRPCNEFAPRGIVIPQPPAINLTPRFDRAIVTVVTGSEGRSLWAITGPSMRAYARSIGADLVVLDWPGHPAWAMSAKFAIPRALDHYERIAYLDADVLCRPGALNLFDLCSPDEFGAYDELPYHRAQPQHKQEQRYLDFRKRLGFPTVDPIPFYVNAGVMVIPRRYAPLLLPPTRPLIPGHTEEQDHTNARLLDAMLDGQLKYRLLDRRANWQSWTDCSKGIFAAAPKDALLHFSGGGAIRNSRMRDLKTFADRTPWLDYRGIDTAEWFDYADLYSRFVREASDLAAFVEVGSWLGRSTAFMAQQIRDSGKRIALYAVDSWEDRYIGYASEAMQEKYRGQSPREIFAANIEACGFSRFVTAMNLPSVEGAKQFADGSLDVVFIDGDHYDVAADIAAWLPKVKRGGILAGHDYNLSHQGAFPVRRDVDAAFGDRIEVFAHGLQCWIHMVN